jgi:beta-lysine 5,6-aminomutase alpha subunit
MFAAIARGAFGDIKRPIDGGKGADGVFERAPDYLNPILDALEAEPAAGASAASAAGATARPALREVK